MRLSIDGVHFEARIFNEIGTLVDGFSYQREHIRLCLNSFAVNLVGDVHRFDQRAVVVREDRTGRSTYVSRARPRGLRKFALSICGSLPWARGSFRPHATEYEVGEFTVGLNLAIRSNRYHRIPTLKQVPRGPP